MQAIDEMTEVVALVQPVERKIQALMLALDEHLIEHGVQIEHIELDTRRFANMNVTITVEQRLTPAGAALCRNRASNFCKR